MKKRLATLKIQFWAEINIIKAASQPFQVICNTNIEIENFGGLCFIQGLILGQFYNNFFL